MGDFDLEVTKRSQGNRTGRLCAWTRTLSLPPSTCLCHLSGYPPLPPPPRPSPGACTFLLPVVPTSAISLPRNFLSARMSRASAHCTVLKPPCSPLPSGPLLPAAQQPPPQQRVPGEAGRLWACPLPDATGGGRGAKPHPDRLCRNPLVPSPGDPPRLDQVHLRRGHVVER